MAERPKDMDGKQALKDIYRPNRYKLDTRFVLDDGKVHPVAIVVPGGGYQMVCSFIEGVPIAKKLNEMDISVVIVYYRVKKKAKFPAPQDDLARAIREVFARAEELHLDLEDYSIWGSSAGGHLVATMGTEALGYVRYGLKKPGMVELTYPVISMLSEHTHQGSHDMLIGKDATRSMEERTSVELLVNEKYPRTFVWCGDADQTVAPENTKRMDAALTAAGIEHETKIYPGVDHGVGPGTETAAEGWIEEAVRFWRG
ncbi:MAG: alpha/beta hydrolase [Lachnospiraceae bacterium]|nr:alpha/beta hydrolase [Lachnospiraceae bacterium]